MATACRAQLAPIGLLLAMTVIMPDRRCLSKAASQENELASLLSAIEAEEAFRTTIRCVLGVGAGVGAE